MIMIKFDKVFIMIFDWTVTNQFCKFCTLQRSTSKLWPYHDKKDVLYELLTHQSFLENIQVLIEFFFQADEAFKKIPTND